MKRLRDRGISAVYLLSLLLLIGWGCARDKGSKALEAAVVPGADVSGSFDYRGAAATTSFREMRAAGEKSDAAGVAEAQRGIVEFEEASGLRREDIVALRFSADLDILGGERLSEKDVLAGIDALAAVSFEKKLDLERLKEGFEALGGGGKKVVDVAVTTYGDRPVLKIDPAGPADPDLYAAVAADGRTLYVAFNTRSLEGAFLREKGKREGISEALARAEGQSTEGAQFRASVVLPESLRGRLRGKIEKMEGEALRNPGLGIVLGVVSPFRDLAHFTVDTLFGGELNIAAAADLGSEGQALQAATLAQTLLLPILRAKIAQQTGGRIADLNEKITVGSKGSLLRVSVKLEPGELTALTPAAGRQASPSM